MNKIGSIGLILIILSLVISNAAVLIVLLRQKQYDGPVPATIIQQRYEKMNGYPIERWRKLKEVKSR